MPANKNRKATCNFFQVKISDWVKKDFFAIVDDIILRKPDIVGRNVPSEDGFLRLIDWNMESKKDGHRIASGTFLRLRVDHNSRIARTDADDLRNLQIEAGFHLTEFFCFCFFERTGTIVVHRNWYAGGHTRLSDYINELYGRDNGNDALVFETALSKSALARFEKMSIINRSEVRIALPKSNAPYDMQGHSVSDAVDLGRMVGAAEMTIGFTKGRRKLPLRLQVKEWIASLIQLYPDSVKAARFEGKANALAEETTIDLLEDRIVERVGLSGVHEKPSPADYIEAIKVAYTKRLPELESLFLE